MAQDTRIARSGPADAPKRADIVLEGGGVKGMALVGSVMALSDAGYTFPRVAGSSAGAIVGSVIAAMQRSGEPMSRAGEIACTLDYSKMRDRRRWARLLSPWPRLANALAVVTHHGVYRGKYLTDWTRGVLGDLGVRTFDDLKFDDPGSDLGPDRSCRFVVTASDLARQRLMYLPWDLPSYQLDPESFSVARAVRASASIPFLFEPVRLKSTYGISTLVDGGILRSYPIEIFDRKDGEPSRWPTIGVRLSSPSSERAPAKPVTGPISLALSLVYTTVDSTQARHVSDPRDVERSIFAKTKGVRWTDFDLTPEQTQSLYEARYAAGQNWLNKHDQRLDAGPIEVTE